MEHIVGLMLQRDRKSGHQGSRSGSRNWIYEEEGKGERDRKVSGAMLPSNTLCLSLLSCSSIHMVPLLGRPSLLPPA